MALGEIIKMEKGYTRAELRREMEANVFACCLLMLEQHFITKMNQLKKEHHEDETLFLLAKFFQVPLFAVVLRVTLLQKP